MNGMHHGISAAQWVDFVEGTLDADAAAKIRSHLGACRECGETFEDLTLAGAYLESSGTHLTQALGDSEASTGRIRRSVMSRVRRSQAVSIEELVPFGVEQLRSILQPVCGAAATEGAMRHAARRCSAESTEQLGHHEWEPFVGHLGAIVDAICGASVAQLVFDTARSLQWEARA